MYPVPSTRLVSEQNQFFSNTSSQFDQLLHNQAFNSALPTRLSGLVNPIIQSLHTDNDNALVFGNNAVPAPQAEGVRGALGTAGVSGDSGKGFTGKLKQFYDSLAGETKKFFDGTFEAIKDTGADVEAAGKLAWRLTTDSDERAKFAESISKITEALQDPNRRDQVLKLIGSELGQDLVDAFTKFPDNPSYYTGYIAGSIVAGGVVGKLVKVAATTAKLDQLASYAWDTAKRLEIKVEGLGSNGGNIKVNLRTKSDLENAYGADNVSSSTSPNNPLQRSNSDLENGIEVIRGANGSKAVRVKYQDPVSGENLIANIPYTERGLPVFDDVTKFTTRIDKTKSYTSQMSQATRDLRELINSGDIPTSAFTAKQLKSIQAGKPKIPDFTWHHNPINNSMQLVPFKVHDAVKHIGERALTEGK